MSLEIYIFCPFDFLSGAIVSLHVDFCALLAPFGVPLWLTLCTLVLTWLPLGCHEADFVHFGVHLASFGVPLGCFEAPGAAEGYSMF